MAIAGAVVFVAAMLLPYETLTGPPPRDVAIIDLAEPARVWAPLALAPVAVLVTAAAGALLLATDRWAPHRAAGMLTGAGVWAALRGASLVGVATLPGGSLGPSVDPSVGSFLALAGGGAVLVAGVTVFTRSPDEVGARSRVVAGLTIVGAVGYALAQLIPAARQRTPGFETADLSLVDPASPDLVLLWEALLPAVVTVILLLAGMRILTGTAGGTGALVMAIGVITTLQFTGIALWATNDALFLSPAPGAFLGIGTGLVLLLAGLLSPTEPAAPGPEPSPATLASEPD